jgi:hypothetical protein
LGQNFPTNEDGSRSKLRFDLGDPDSPEPLSLTTRDGAPVVLLRPGWMYVDYTLPSLINQLLDSGE